jgi:tripartite-type tricarboxylate transporter receptor subunit TctC
MGPDRPSPPRMPAAPRLARRALLAAPALLLAGRARADWPDRPIRLVAPFPAGSGTDVLARVLAPVLQRELGQPIVVDNRPGANGVLGSQSAAQSAPDGYTLVILGTSAAAINPHLVKKMPYDVARDFAMVGTIGETPYVLCVPADGPKDLRSFLDQVRARGDATFSYGNAGALIMASTLASMTGLRVTPVPYRGGAEAITDVAAGRIDANFADFIPAMSQAQGGRVRIIGHSMARSFSVAPELPSISATVPGFDMNVWWTIAAPAGTPAAIIARASQALGATLAAPEVVERLASMGDAPMRMTPAETTRFVAREHQAWGERVRIAGIEPQ